MELEIDNFLNAATYEDICDYSIIPPEGKNFNKEILEKDCVIFCKTDFIGYLFDNLRNSSKNYVVLTHHSDYEIDRNVFSSKPKNVIKWFAINATHKDDGLVCIPLGLKTHKGIYMEERYMTSWLIPEIDNLRSNVKENMVYCNWGQTNQYRNTIIDKLNMNSINYQLEYNLTFDKYATNMSKCKFVISPPGNGIDCHRTWESLYMGCIPVVIRNPIYDNWKELPILQVNDYSELTNDLMNSFVSKDFSYDMLYMKHWEKIIKSQL